MYTYINYIYIYMYIKLPRKNKSIPFKPTPSA